MRRAAAAAAAPGSVVMATCSECKGGCWHMVKCGGDGTVSTMTLKAAGDSASHACCRSCDISDNGPAAAAYTS